MVFAFVAPGANAASPTPWPQNEYNPKPAAGDVVLPMPCGGAMVFRKVVVPSDGPLSDRLITIGAADDARGYVEGALPAYIAGSFGANESRHYLIGKYEVTELQYQSLDASCPQPTPDRREPQTEIGWADAVAFANRYTLWLRQNAPDKLEKDDNELGFLRLPTEIEWEYAARGGISVSESDFVERVFPTPEGGLSAYVWFAGSTSSNNKVQKIGLLKPNPLGIHDILGNVDEMMLEPFRLNKLDRLHGQAGGFIIRGGNFTTAESDIRVANRHEAPFYKGAEPRRAKTTGFRLVAVAPVITSRERLRTIEQEWADLGATPPAPAAKAGAAAPSAAPSPSLGPTALDDPVAELGVVAAAASDPNMQNRLKSLQLAFRASFAQRDEQRDRAAKARLRLGTFLCQKLKDDGAPIDRLKDAYKACVDARGAQHERCVGQKTIIGDEEAKQYENMRYYADTIVTLTNDYDDLVIDRQSQILRSELAAVGLAALEPITNVYGRHVAEYRKDKTIRRSEWLAACKKGV